METYAKYQIRIHCTTDKQNTEIPLKDEWFTLSHYRNEKEFWSAVHQRFSKLQNKTDGYVYPVISHWSGPAGISDLISPNFIDHRLFNICQVFSPDKLKHLFEHIDLYRNPEIFGYPTPFDDMNKLKKWIENYIGKYDSELNFIEKYLGKILPPIPEQLEIYFDMKAYKSSLLQDKYIFIEGHIFKL